MVRSRHRPHHAHPHRAVFLDRPGGPHAAARQRHHPNALRLGTTSRRLPSSMPSPSCDDTCGWRPRVFQCRRPTTTGTQRLSIYMPGLSIPSPTPLERTKSSLGTAGCGGFQGPDTSGWRGFRCTWPDIRRSIEPFPGPSELRFRKPPPPDTPFLQWNQPLL